MDQISRHIGRILHLSGDQKIAQCKSGIAGGDIEIEKLWERLSAPSHFFHNQLPRRQFL